MQKSYSNILALVSIMLVIVMANCKKSEDFTDSPVSLKFSTDSVLFDTVFTTVGSSTQWLKVYNPTSKDVKINSIRLAGGENSFFRINIDGSPATSLNNIELMAKDSIFIFVEVTVDPNNSNNPLIVVDSILFNTNGKMQDIKLAAWGQDAHFIVADTHIEGLPDYKIVAGEGETTTWTNDKPYVVYGYAVVDSTGILNINQGVQVHFHDGSGLWVYKGGALKVNGTQEAPVVFQGDRLENYYKDVPGQWDRIWLNEGSINNEIHYAIIKNGFIGIQAETLQENMGNGLIIDNTIIQNMSGAGILARTYAIDATNMVIADCKQYLAALTMGGSYTFRHSTFANYWDHSIRQEPSIFINNYFVYEQVAYPIDLVNAYFGNCIMYGSNSSEVMLDKNNDAVFNPLFENCLVKSDTGLGNAFRNCIKNEDPLFVDTDKEDYSLQENSPAIDAGKDSIANLFQYDINGNMRYPEPDLGAYEYQAE